MEESKKVYWQGVEQLANSPEYIKHAGREFPEAPEQAEDPGHNRRDFLKMMGFGMSAVALAACEAPIRKAIPYVNKPVDLDPSIANYYASSYINGGEYCSIVVKTREGRPIKIDGNALSTVTHGCTNAQVEASVLSLYDNARMRGPKKGNEKISWESLDSEVIAKLNQIEGEGGQIRIVSNSVLSPSAKAAFAKFTSKFPSTQLVQYDQSSAYGMLKANQESIGAAVIPSYDFSKASVIVSVAADFLNSWIAPIEFNMQYAKTRDVNTTKDMSRHYQFESIMSLTGANADYRTQIKPSEEGAVVVQLYNLIAAKAGRPTIAGGVEKTNLEKAANDLWAARGKALVVAGANDKAIQIVVNGINDMLGSYGLTILPGLPVHYRQGNDEAMHQLLADAEAGVVDALIFYNCNPVYDHPEGKRLAEIIKKLGLTVSTSYKEEETGTLTNYMAPDHHFLEAWIDAEPKKGLFSLSQPTITPIYKTRSALESFLIWSGDAKADAFEFVKNNWKTWFYKGATSSFQEFWDKCLYDGVLTGAPAAEAVGAGAFTGDLNAAASAISGSAGGGFELVIYESGNIGNGSQANNPLLQELPDPITKAVWDHYITVSPKDAKEIDFSESITKIYSVTVGNVTVKLPALVQPGQTPGTIGIPLGFGRTKAGKVADGIGANVYPMVALVNGALSYNVANVKFEKTGETYQIAQTQTHNTFMARKTVIQETVLEDYKQAGWERDFQPTVSTWTDPEHKVHPDAVKIWKGHQYPNHHWGMAIDLNTCVGCAACVVACNVENNISLVGREEVINRREMHWMRIDRYYSSDALPDDRLGLEVAADNPQVVFQPMMCQHCNNAPCETVCPVAATTHSTEGLNQMVYNRCIGTRYCANNCPYKVRRFNWFKYHDNKQFAQANPAMNTDLGKMVLNPDVTVRSRGVMEKCSMCVQRIQGAKLTAKKERRPLVDDDLTMACESSCSTGAITFGDMNDPNSKLSKLLQLTPRDPKNPAGMDKIAHNPRAYQVLEEVGVKPNVWYLTKVRNTDKNKA